MNTEQIRKALAKKPEKILERKFYNWVKKMGGLALKFSSASHTKFPDRITLIPGGFTFWAEFKAEGEEPSPAQQSRIRTLKKLGFTVFVIDDENSLQLAQNRIASKCQLCGDTFKPVKIMQFKSRKASDEFLRKLTNPNDFI